MEKIDLNVGRGFSDCITVMFNFVKQEFKPLMKAAGFIVLPLLLVDMVLKSFFISDIFAYTSLIDEGNVLWDAGYWWGIGGSYLLELASNFWLMLFSVAYLRVYADKGAGEGALPVMPGEVWRVMRKYVWVALLGSILISLVVFFGMLFFILPGIYMSVEYAFVLYFMIVEGKSMTGSMSASARLVSGYWWNTFGYLLVLWLIVSMLSNVLNMPSMVLSFKTALAGEEPSAYAMTFCVLLATLGQYLLMIVGYVGAGVRFFSLREQKEHAALLDKINEIGKS